MLKKLLFIFHVCDEVDNRVGNWIVYTLVEEENSYVGGTASTLLWSHFLKEGSQRCLPERNMLILSKLKLS